jgi:hypothetical protein
MKRNSKNTKLKKDKRRATRKLKEKNKNSKKKESINAAPYEGFMHINEQIMSPTFGQFCRVYQLDEKLSGKNRDELLLVLAGICFDREYHSTIVIIESIIHQSLISCSGDESITEELCSELFNIASSSYIGTWPDPAEDIMVGAIHTEVGTFRILEGLWESCGFYCQLFISVIEEMPQQEPFNSLRNSIDALLSISDLAVERAGLTRYERGSDEPLGELTFNSINFNKARSICCFTEADLVKLRIDENELSPFILAEGELNNLHREILGESSLERKPLIRSRSGEIILALPTAVGYSIRMFIIDYCIKSQMRENLEYFYQKSFVDHFSKKSRLLGKLEDIPFNAVRHRNKIISGAEAIVQIDQGRYIHFIMHFDDFADCKRGANSISPNGHVVSSVISRAILDVQENVCEEEGFVRGLSVIIVCGWGRLVAPDLHVSIDKAEWDIEFVSAPDLDTFNRIPQMSPHTFWRMIEAKRIVEKAGVKTQNINGLLNLYAWAKSNNNNIIPHEDIPADLLSASQLFMMIQLNSYLETRWETKFHEDIHKVINPRSGLILITRYMPASYFKEDALKPIYVSVSDLSEDNLIALIKGEFSQWWCQPIVKHSQDRDFIYKVWEAICGWVLRLDKALFKFLSYRNGKQIILDFEIDESALPSEVTEPPTPDSLKKLIDIVCVDDTELTIKIILKEGYLSGFHQHKNYAESLIVQALLDALNINFTPSSDRALLKREIFEAAVPNQLGKHIHLHKADGFIDYVQRSLPMPLRQDQFDHANLKIGLGWVGDIKSGSQSEIVGVKECTDYLQRLTFSLWLQIKEILNKLNRGKLIVFLLLQHEAIEVDSIHWQRTFTAILNLHEDHEDVYAVVTERVASNNAMLSGIRILLEMAICEAKDSSSTPPNHLDVSKLIMLATSIFQYGNLSDSIHFEMVEPKIKITALGDVHFNHSFSDLVVIPYGNHMQARLINSVARKYAKRFDNDDLPVSEEMSLDKEFELAWLDEYGINIDTVLNILDLFDEIGIKKEQAVYEVSESELLSQAEKIGIQSEHLFVFFNIFTLPSRENWDDLPQGFKIADISPWRFRRRLSSVAKPLFKIDEYIVSPNLIRKGVAYLFTNAYDGSLDGSFFNSKAMKSWIGRVRDEKGHNFNNQAKIRFEELGLKAESDVKVSKILQRKTEKDFGDVDALAWDLEKGIVYLVECKDLEFSKTPGEIAKQIYEFRGQVRHDGKDDRLKKHLERCEILKENREALIKYLNMDALYEVHIVLLFRQAVPIPYHNPINQLPIKIVFFDTLSSLLDT